MGRKIFITYKYADSDVQNISKNATCTVRDYVDKLQEILTEDHINKGEKDNEDLSKLSETVIWEKLKNRIYDSTLTIIMISKNMKEIWKEEKNQWIPREISYSLKEMSRTDRAGNSVVSKSNALLAVILPDYTGNYNYYLENKNCCSEGCRQHKTDQLFKIISENMFNLKNPDTKNCESESKIYYGDSSYIPSIEWNKFIKNPSKYIDKAYEIQENIENYTIQKEV